MKNRTAPNAKSSTNTTVLAPLRLRRPNIRTFTSGSLRRRSIRTNPSSSTTPAASTITNFAEANGQGLGASFRARVSAPSPANESARPV